MLLHAHGSHDDIYSFILLPQVISMFFSFISVQLVVVRFRATRKVDDVEVNPILIQKGLTKLALYGMGSMRDERLNRMWQQKKVRSVACAGFLPG